MTHIVDAQVHVWPPQSEQNQWTGETHNYLGKAGDISSAARESFSGEDLLAELAGAGVDRAVLVPPVFGGDDNGYALAAAARYPDRFAVMGRFQLDRPDPERVRNWLSQPRMVGIRLTFFYDRHVEWLSDETVDWIWPILAETGIPTAVFAPGNTPKIEQIARRYPDMRLVIDHFGIPQRARDAEIVPFVEQLLPVADLENVRIKASALTSHSTGPFPFTVLHEPIRRVVAAFGAERVFWGSELTRQPQPYDECVRLFSEGLTFLSDAERALIMGDAISAWLDWAPTPTPAA